MSYVDITTLKPAELIAHYVLDCRGQALFLPYQDYAVIDEWLGRAQGDLDALLLILADVLPPFFGGQDGRSGAKSLVSIRKLVLRRLLDLRMVHTEALSRE